MLHEALATIRFGKVSAIDPAKCRVRVVLADYDDLETAWLPVLVRKSLRDQDYSMPDLGEHVALLLDAHGEDGLVLGAIYSSVTLPPVQTEDKRHITFADGGSVEYDRATGDLMVIAMGRVVVEAATSITLKSPSVRIEADETTVTGALHVQGAVTLDAALDVAGNIHSDGSIIDVAGNSNHHTHP